MRSGRGSGRGGGFPHLRALALACAPAVFGWPACEPAQPKSIADCTGAERDPCLSNLAVSLMGSDPDAGIAALQEIQDPVARLAAGGAIFASRDMAFDFATSTKICAALRDSFEEGFCQRRLGQGHLRSTQ